MVTTITEMLTGDLQATPHPPHLTRKARATSPHFGRLQTEEEVRVRGCNEVAHRFHGNFGSLGEWTAWHIIFTKHDVRAGCHALREMECVTPGPIASALTLPWPCP